jgi:hypothetical protein
MVGGARCVVGVDQAVVLEPMANALAILADDARSARAPAAGPLADIVAVLRVGVRDVARAAQMRAGVSDCGQVGGSVVDDGAADVHGAVHAPELLSIADASSRSGVGERQLRRLAKAGRLPGARKVGGRWIVEANELCGAAWDVLLLRPATR